MISNILIISLQSRIPIYVLICNISHDTCVILVTICEKDLSMVQNSGDIIMETTLVVAFIFGLHTIMFLQSRLT